MTFCRHSGVIGVVGCNADSSLAQVRRSKKWRDIVPDGQILSVNMFSQNHDMAQDVFAIGAELDSHSDTEGGSDAFAPMFEAP